MKRPELDEPVQMRAAFSLTGDDPAKIQARLRKYQDPRYQLLVRMLGQCVETVQITMGAPAGVVGVLVDFAAPTHPDWHDAGNAVIAVTAAAGQGWTPDRSRVPGREWWGRKIVVNPAVLTHRLFVNRVHLQLTEKRP